MDLELRGAVSVITGDASGIGRACAEALAAEGARVAVLDRAAEGEAVAGSLRASGAEAIFVDADLTDEHAVMSAVAQVAKRWETIDTIVGCAGLSGPVGTPLAETDVADWDAVMSVNVRGNSGPGGWVQAHPAAPDPPHRRSARDSRVRHGFIRRWVGA